MTRRWIELDDDDLDAARLELGTTGVSDTVRAAVRHVGTRSARAREIEWLTSGGMEQMADKTARDQVWR